VNVGGRTDGQTDRQLAAYIIEQFITRSTNYYSYFCPSTCMVVRDCSWLSVT